MQWNYFKLRQLSLLQSATDSYYKLRQLFYYKVRHGLLQIATGITKCDQFITNFYGYYKVRWLSQTATVPSHLLNIIYFSQALYILSSSQLCATLFKYIYLSLPSYVLTNRKFAKWTFRSEPELLINVMVLYSDQSPLFFRKIVENEHYRWPYWPGRAWTIVKARGTIWEPWGPLSRYIWIQ